MSYKHGFNLSEGPWHLKAERASTVKRLAFIEGRGATHDLSWSNGSDHGRK